MVFVEETELVERSLRRRAYNKGCSLMKCGSDYTIIQNGQPLVTVDDEDCWSILQSM